MDFLEKNAKLLAWTSALLFLIVSTSFLYLLFSNGLRAFYILLSDPTSMITAYPLPLLLHRFFLVQRIFPAVIGTLSVISLAVFFAAPLGIAIGIWLSFFASPHSKRIMHFVIQLLASTPSIVLGFAGYCTMLWIRQKWGLAARPCLLLAALSLCLLILPVLIRATENSLLLVSKSLNLTGLALGFSPLQNAIFLILPKARRGIGRGIFLATVRAAEDTAIIMLTGAVADAVWPNGLLDPFSSLSVQVLYGISEYRGVHDQLVIFATSLVLVSLTFLLSYIGERCVSGKPHAK